MWTRISETAQLTAVLGGWSALALLAGADPAILVVVGCLWALGVAGVWQ